MDLNELDFENIGSWPLLHRVIFIISVCVMLSGAFFYYVTMPQIERLEQVEAKEVTLKNDFKIKAALSSNLEEYRAQMAEIKIIFDGLLNKLPSNAEVASLLDNISFIGADNGLQFKSINWGVTKDEELSVEVPISIQVVGKYEELGSFAADIAALPRIVILDNLKLTKGNDDLMTLNVIAKTYRYKGGQK
ncbi:MAG TPA: type 4a pilus biogenesis protein PilO [Psychromonas sp.]